MTRPKKLILTALLTVPVPAAFAIPDPIICEDTLDGSSPFNVNDVPCLLGCGAPIAVATGSLLPGSVNETAIPYCQLDCVHTAATPEQSSAAPGCYSACHVMNQATPENVGWCMFWCVEGYSELVTRTACVPSLEYGSVVTTTIDGMTVTERPFTEPSEWSSWYLTQTVLSRSGVDGQAVTATPGPSVTATPSSTVASKTSATLSPSTSGEVPQETSTLGSVVDVESAVDSASGGQSVVSTTTTGAGCMTMVSLLPMLGVVGVMVLLS
ncbi:uncharacterized protein F4807DRAFT_15648 [Annulohypoxylon truncatum]|uniref:uncharacterized protein n=1 Tax=Annulohypoxylon truncatum TaxID=327061 RepID=UPI0020082798|nr:uncharacterized protein F4807DRAFT_15648 [Annulohypoxylon truncatum]KAI1214972.1 hypothetical protein F4807DRAFT_15648 [Annulohypoxylon truncatum]